MRPLSHIQYLAKIKVHMRASRSAFRAIVYAVLYAFCNDYFYLLLIMYLKLKGLKCTAGAEQPSAVHAPPPDSSNRRQRLDIQVSRKANSRRRPMAHRKGS